MTKLLFPLLGMLLLIACNPSEADLITPLKVGKEDVREVVLHRQSARQIILEGGNGKYHANIADSKIADLTLRQDTLTIKALLEGETFATVLSHDQQARIAIKVSYPELSFSTDSIRLYPKDQSKFVSLFGGDPYVQIIRQDPDDILDVKWDASTHLLEINAHYEGQAEIIARTQAGDEQRLKVLVKAEDEPQDWGIYSTGNRYFGQAHSITNRMIVHRPTQGIWISSVANPNGGFAFTYSGTVLKIAPIVAPQVGSYVDVRIEKLIGPDVGIAAGTYKAYVEKVTEEGVMLRSARHKFYLPYDTIPQNP